MTTKKIAFVTDSTVFLTEQLRSHPDVYIVPMVVISDGIEYDDANLTSDKLYDIIRSEKEIPKTSQPNSNKFHEQYEQLKENYDQAIAIHVSSELSGTLSSSDAGKNQANFSVEIIDSLSLSYGITDLLTEGLALAEKGVEVPVIASRLRERAAHGRNLILLGSLEQLYKGGRMSGAQFLLGNLLKIKPILSITSTGKLELKERIRSEKKAINRLIALIKESNQVKNVKEVGIMHGNALEKARDLSDRINKEIPNLTTVIGEISSSLAVHAGEGTVAVFWNEGK
ncbi:DegV family protein [Oceanobacillus chungangensis]|uniref:DegV family protein n=1 Tax=Oceanobacillus chungangensis TaxID=1229152 RepID=A0A3D8PIW5_9BACI|nr:DegV family protein [Oceanobacillus chungangensis]RDW15592.1 DegV family protein [Oceanobacillus chungangensis]